MKIFCAPCSLTSISILALTLMTSCNSSDSTSSDDIPTVNTQSYAQDGVNCYDGLADQNSDGKLDVLDCRGKKGETGAIGPKGDQGDSGTIQSINAPKFIVGSKDSGNLLDAAFTLGQAVKNISGYNIVVNGAFQATGDEFCSATLDVRWPGGSWILLHHLFKHEDVLNLRLPINFVLAPNAEFRISKGSNNRCLNSDFLLNPGQWTFHSMM